MSSASPVILILGAGPNVGQSVARAFAAKGYRVALTARKATESSNTANEIHIQSDLSDPNSVVSVFSKVKASLGIPSVVIYNAASVTRTPADDPLSVPIADFNRDFNVNTVSAFVAAQQAASGFAQLPGSASRTFIFTGNCTNISPIAALFDSGVGKAATANIVQCAAAAYKARGYKFYYADERNTDGSPAYSAIDGEAHGKTYVELAGGKEQGPWLYTFVKGSGYKQFPLA